MNDFTKEELQIILESLVFFNKASCPDHEKSFHEKEKECIKKIQSMIDNYCEHEQMKVDMGDYYEVYPCKKCGVF